MENLKMHYVLGSILVFSHLGQVKNSNIMLETLFLFWNKYSRQTDRRTISSYSARNHLEMWQVHTSVYIYQHYSGLVHSNHNINFSNKCYFKTYFDH